MVSSLVCFGLLSAWAATSPRHWFVRTGVLAGVLSLLLLIPAYEPVVVFALQGLTVAAGVQVHRWWKRRKEGRGLLPKRTRFSLATVLLLMVYVAIAAAVISRMPERGLADWFGAMHTGTVLGIAILLGMWMVHGTLERWWRRIILSLVLSLGLSLSLLWNDWAYWSFAFYDGSDALWIFVNICITALTGFLLWLRSGITNGESIWFCSHWKGITASTTLYLSVIAVMVPPASVYYQLINPLAIPETVLPDPNGWDDLVAAAAITENWKFNNTPYYYDTAPLKELYAAVKEMELAYQRVESGLAKEVQKPLDYSEEIDFNFDTMRQLRALSRALSARGLIAKIENRIADSASDYLKAIQLGYTIRCGGLVIEVSVGIGSAGNGRRGLFDLRYLLSKEESQMHITELLKLESIPHDLETIDLQERVWTQHALGWQGHLWQIIEDMNGGWDYIEFIERPLVQEKAEMRLLCLELAIQAWRLEHGKLPESLDDLVPEIIAEIPVDPFDPEGQLMRYLRTDEGNGNGYILYSLGSNGVDDGGTPPDEGDYGAYETGDLRLDVRYAPDPAVAEVEQDELDDVEVEE